MTPIQKLRTPRIQRSITAALSLGVLLVLPRWGGHAVLVGAAASLVVYTVIFDCDGVVRTIMGVLAALACAAAAYFVLGT